MYRGAGFFTYLCTPSLINTTITRNRCTSASASATGAGVTAYGGSSVAGRNNIICDNNATTSPNISGTANLTYSDVQGGLAGTGNINADPLFLHTPPSGYCFLSQIAAGQAQDSPCVDAGDPATPMITGSTRSDFVQDAGVVDMGFHWSGPFATVDGLMELLMDELIPEMEDNQGSQAKSMNLKLCNHPNPFNPTTTISLSLDHASPAELTVYDVAGKLISTLYQGNLEAGMHEFLFSGTSLPTGMYIYRADLAGKVLSGKALLVK